MGFEGTRIWRKGAEEVVVRSDTKFDGMPELVEQTLKQARRVAENNSNLVTVFKSKGYQEQMLQCESVEEQITLANSILNDMQTLIPDTIEDPDERVAFVLAFHEVLQSPEFNN